MPAVILGLDPAKCDGIYPRTRAGQCQGCGIVGEHPRLKRPYHSPTLTYLGTVSELTSGPPMGSISDSDGSRKDPSMGG